MTAKPRTLEFMLGLPVGLPFVVDWSPFFEGDRGGGRSIWMIVEGSHAKLLSHGGKVLNKPLEAFAYDHPEGHWGYQTPATLENVWVIDFERPDDPIKGMTQDDIDDLRWLGFQI